MVEKRLDEGGKIYAYCEWNVLDDKGHFDDKGSHIWVQDIWIHKDHRKNGAIRDIINTIGLQRMPLAEYVYWRRGKYQDRVKIYETKKIIKEHSFFMPNK